MICQRWTALFAAAAAMIFPAGASAIEIGQVNTFEDTSVGGGLENWNNGIDNPSLTLSNVATGGPAGLDDNYLKLISTGGFGAGSRLVMLNRNSPWTGNYVAAGVTHVAMDFLHLSSPDNGALSMRIALLDAGFQGYASQTAFGLTHNNAWQHAVFSLSDLIPIGLPPALDSLEVTEFRVFHSTTSGNIGQSDVIAAQIGIDNITAVGPELVPGDFDGDQDVDGADFVVWQTNFPTASGTMLDDGDADGDGDVDGADFVVWQTNFPTTPGPAVSPVPEPASVGLAIVAFGCIVFAGRPQR